MYIIFDVGGTNTRVAASLDLLTYGEPIKFRTPANYEEGFTALTTAIARLKGEANITSIAGGIRGPLNPEKTAIMSESILTDWVNRPLATALADQFSAPVFLENDAALGGLGEAVFGAGKDYNIVVYHTVSTGVGGARYVKGVLDPASVGFEPGHQIIDVDQSVLENNVPHTLENLVSGAAVEARRGCKPYEIPQTDPIWDELAYYLALGLQNTIMYWSPDAIVLGGSMIVGDPRILRTAIIGHLKKSLNNFVPCPPILDAVLKDEGGLYGAMALLKTK